MPWMMTLVSLWMRIDNSGGLHLRDRPPGGLEHGDRPVAVLDAVLAENLEALVLPGARDAEDRDRLGGGASGLDAAPDHTPRDDVDPRVRDHVHHHADLHDARRREGQP